MPIYIPNTFDSVGEAVVDGVSGFLLDQYPGVRLALSLRRLSSSYLGSAIRVRRSSDSAEQDIGFDSNGDFDTTALTTFCTGTDGFAKTWYDQSGNNFDFTNATAGGQPKIYDSITGVNFSNLKAALLFNLKTLSNGSSIISPAGNMQVAWVAQRDTANETGAPRGLFDTFGDRTIFDVKPSGWLYDGTYKGNFIDYANEQKIVFLDLVSPTANSYINGAFYQSVPYTQSAIFSSNVLGSGGSTLMIGNLQEFIIWDGSQSSNVQGIQTNQNQYYQTYIPYTYDLQEFDTSGTWTKPANCLMAEVVIVGAGGGGASGSKQSSGSTSQGGTAGPGGSVIYNTFLASSLGATESVTIGVAGSGGAAVTQNSTNGTTGGGGGTSSFGSHCALPGAPGAPYDTAVDPIGAWDAGVVRNSSGFVNARTGQQSSVSGTGNGVNGDTQTGFIAVLSRAPSGGSIAAASTGIGGAGNRLYNSSVSLNTAAAASAINTGVKSGDGLSNWSANFSVGPIMWGTGNIGTMHYGTSGAGGSASQNPTNGGDAGDSGNYGQGGAGGGAAQNGGGVSSGAGGNAGGACIKVLSVCYPS